MIYGLVKGITTNMYAVKNAIPTFLNAPPVPYALLEHIKRQIRKLQKQGIIWPVEFSLILCVTKPNGSVRIWGNFIYSHLNLGWKCMGTKVIGTVQESKWITIHPIPKPHNLFPNRQGSEVYGTWSVPRIYKWPDSQIRKKSNKI